ncbi:hypothetical protein SAMN05421823_10563 [Catalinimonas alkaloidigena]|uniref:Carboxypeptidase regulatory-like domain-containing protein n=1 Tax=Catalinimonas alkaloidigena TaxID=1075417 RepID=A0A1G9IPA5_9BACT|nr:carboxypeptidase-like regulatory domain-containing protein [Catalinimonas alkaloidigena]SDL26982.1 hypothetical protein SAMN05421823_10563 [Catalinimonas alkaloidigena]
MKKLLLLGNLGIMLGLLNCTDPDMPAPADDKKYAAGKVVDTQGRPLSGADIVVSNTQYYNDNILGKTDAAGNYQLEVTPGSWYVIGTIDVTYDNKKYTLDLDPESSDAFAGTEGAVRNFRWKLTGERPDDFGGGGYYGGSMEVIGVLGFFDVDQVELTLEPVMPLIDGSTGQTLRLQPQSSMIEDIPLGKYKITARYLPDNAPMNIRIRDKNQAYGPSVTDSFDPIYPGAEALGIYSITVEVEPN